LVVGQSGPNSLRASRRACTGLPLVEAMNRPIVVGVAPVSAGADVGEDSEDRCGADDLQLVAHATPAVGGGRVFQSSDGQATIESSRLRSRFVPVVVQ